MKFSIMSLGTMVLNIMALSTKALSIKILRIITFSISIGSCLVEYHYAKWGILLLMLWIVVPFLLL